MEACFVSPPTSPRLATVLQCPVTGYLDVLNLGGETVLTVRVLTSSAATSQQL